MVYDTYIISGLAGFRFDSDLNRVSDIRVGIGSIGLKTKPVPNSIGF